MEQPLLSIGIPTYNRCKLLEGLLECIFNQYNKLKNPNSVEVVISDNKSTDDTQKVVYKYIEKGLKIRYSYNEENIGANNNILKIGNELTKGKYTWIIGDDDLIRDDGIEYYLSILNLNPEVELLYLNHTNELDSDRISIIKDLPIYEKNIMCSQKTDQKFDNGQKILNLTKQNALFTCVSSFIFETKVWKENFIGYQEKIPFNNLSNTFPHTVILSSNLIQKKVFYVGFPYLAFFTGAQGWFSAWELLLASRGVELTDLFEKKGASNYFLKLYRERIFKDSVNAFHRKYTSEKLPIWFNVDLKKYASKYYKYKNFRYLYRVVAFRLLKNKVKSYIKV